MTATLLCMALKARQQLCTCTYVLCMYGVLLGPDVLGTIDVHPT